MENRTTTLTTSRQNRRVVEARGLSEDVRLHLEGLARLPMVGKAESLNVAIAGGVLMYGWLQVNWGGTAVGHACSDGIS
jgi:tRNA(Leu) C34 or U34 (ribose-2'-O)-methylase TrmL